MLLSTPLSSYVKTHKNCYCRAIFILIALVIIALVCKTISVNNKKYVESLQNQDAYLLAKSGLEKALTDYLSDPFNYSGGTIIFPAGTVTVNLDGDLLTSTGQVGDSHQTIQSHIDNPNNLIIASWQEFSP